MKTIYKASTIGLATLLLTVVISCKDNYATTENSVAIEEAVDAANSISNSNAKEAIASSAAVEPKNSKRKVIRTADIKFKVKNVPKTTYAIEDATTKFGGFVTYTNL